MVRVKIKLSFLRFYEKKRGEMIISLIHSSTKHTALQYEENLRDLPKRLFLN